MGKCAAYWRARDEGKECGVPESRLLKSRQDHYRNEIVADLVAMGAMENDVFELLPYSLCFPGRGRKCKDVSLGSLRRDSPLRKQMLDVIFSQIVSGKKICRNDLSKGEFSRENWKIEDYERHYPPKSCTSAIHNDKIEREPARGNPPYGPGITHAHNSLKRNPIPPSSTKTVDGVRTCITIKKGNLSGLCTAGQYGILQKMNLAGYGDDEYTAFCIALKWALDRLESEKVAKEAQL